MSRLRGVGRIYRTIVDVVTGKSRRVRVVRHLGFLGYVVRWSECCSGCTDTPEMTAAPERGFGCHECGHTGRRRREFFVPFNHTGFDQMQDRRWRKAKASSTSPGPRE
jgi:hypothetical protein